MAGDIGGGWHFFIKGVNRNQVDIRPTRKPKQIIGSRVVTSVTIVESMDETNKKKYEEEYMKHRKEQYKKQSMQPKFEFYLYNDAGRIIKQRLSIHEIQQILLQQSQNLGLKQLGWLIGRNMTNLVTATSTSKLPLNMTVPKKDILTTLMNTAKVSPATTP